MRGSDRSLSEPQDYMRFGSGSSFDAKGVQLALDLTDDDLARIASVPLESRSPDVALPERVRARLEEVGNCMNLIVQVFDGDVDKAVVWFKTRNPLLGDVAPRDMIRLGRYEGLRKFIASAMVEGRTSHPRPSATDAL